MAKAVKRQAADLPRRVVWPETASWTSPCASADRPAHDTARREPHHRPPGAMEEGTRRRTLERRKISVDRMSYKDGDAKHT